MITDLKNRKLTWYFENVWLPEHHQNMHGSLVGAVRRAVADFVLFADVDPELTEISDDSLQEFERYCRARRCSYPAAKRKAARILEIVQHAIPKSAHQPEWDKVHGPPSDGSLRQYVRNIYPTLKPDLKGKTLAYYAYVVDQFCNWLQEDIALEDVIPEILHAYEESAFQSPEIGKSHAVRIRSIMRTFDPIRFKVKVDKRDKRQSLDTGNGSEFLLSNVYQNRYEPQAIRGDRPNTKRLYQTTLRMFDRFLGRSATLDDLNDETYAAYSAWRLEKVSRHTVKKDQFNLLALWRWCHRRHLVENWPDVKIEMTPRAKGVAWNQAELQKIFTTIRKLDGRVGKYLARDWWAALLLVAWNTLERINAVIHLEWCDIDLDAGWVRFRAENRKGGLEDNVKRLSDQTTEALRRIAQPDGAVFPWPYSYTYLWNRFSRILQLAGLPHDSKSKFHRIRKTGASYAEAAGANATAMLLHSKREITEAYLDPRITKPQQPIDVLFRLTEPAIAGE